MNRLLVNVLHIVVCCLFILPLQAQIVNIERKRLSTDSSGWSGSVAMNIAAQRNTSNVFSISTGSHLAYDTADHHVLILMEYSLIKAGSQSFSDELFTHMRYGYTMTKQTTWESFFQYQRNRLTNLNYRLLIGSGPRFKLTNYDNASFFWGAVYMMELDDTTDPSITSFNHRLSSYFTFTLRPQEDVFFTSTSYIQPRIDLWSDYRIQTESSLNLSITNKLGLHIRFSLSYDAEPPASVPGLTYHFINGLTYAFN